MGFLPVEHPLEPEEGGGIPPTEASAPPGGSAHMSAEPLAILGRAAARLEAALDDNDIPPGTIPNVLGALAKIAIAQAEITIALPPPGPSADDERLERVTHEAADAVQASFVSLLELTEQARDILSALDQRLAELRCPFSQRVRVAIRWARSRAPRPPTAPAGSTAR